MADHPSTGSYRESSQDSPDLKQAKTSLLARFQSLWTRQEAITSLNIGGGSFAPKPAPPAPQPPEQSLTFADDSAVRRAHFTSRQASGVPSPRVDDMRRAALWGDMQERVDLYKQIDLILASDPIAERSREESIEGALGQDCTQLVEPAPGFEQDPEAIDMAGTADLLWQQLAKTETVQDKKETLRCGLDYGNVFLEGILTDYGTIECFELFPPYAVDIRSNHRLKFKPEQMDAYVQFDAAELTRELARWPESAIIHWANRKYRWQRHGLPVMLAGLGYSTALIRGTALLPDAREAGQPQVAVRFQDVAGNPIDPTALIEYAYTTRKMRRQRGEPIDPNDEKLFNGAGEVSLLEHDGAFWNELSDIRWFAAGVAMLYGENLARLITPETINRATMEQMDEMRFLRWYLLSIMYSENIDKQKFGRMIIAYNGAYSKLTLSKRLGIDPRKVLLKTEWKARRSPGRLIEESERAESTCEKGQLSVRDALEIHCRALELDSERAWNRLLAEQGEGVKRPLRQIRTAPPAEPKEPKEPENSLLIN